MNNYVTSKVDNACLLQGQALAEFFDMFYIYDEAELRVLTNPKFVTHCRQQGFQDILGAKTRDCQEGLRKYHIYMGEVFGKVLK